MADDTKHIIRLLEEAATDLAKERARHFKAQLRADKLLARQNKELAEMRKGLLADLQSVRIKLKKMEDNTAYIAIKLGRADTHPVHPNLRL